MNNNYDDKNPFNEFKYDGNSNEEVPAEKEELESEVDEEELQPENDLEESTDSQNSTSNTSEDNISYARKSQNQRLSSRFQNNKNGDSLSDKIQNLRGKNVNNLLNNSLSNKNSDQNKSKIEAGAEKVAAKVGSKAITAATGGVVNGPIADMIGKKLAGPMLKQLKIRLMIIGGVIGFFILLILPVIFQGNGKIQDREQAINYLQTGIDEDVNSFNTSDLYKYLQDEGWCKTNWDCYNSPAGQFYRAFRKQILATELKYTTKNDNEICEKNGYTNVVLDASVLYSTIVYGRADDELFIADDKEEYSDRLSIYKAEMASATEGMVREVEVEYEEKENGKKVKKIQKCYSSDLETYRDYLIGDGVYYSAPGTENLSGNTSGGVTSAKVDSFISSIASWAESDMSQSGIYASITIAQAILEGGSGKSTLAKTYNNHFGMKGTGGSCTSSLSNTTKDGKSNGVWDGTSVCMCGKDGCYWYRAYNNIGESLADHSRNFWKTASYGRNGVLDCVQNNLGALEQITRIKQAGYAEDPNYVSKVMSIINTYNLTQYDSSTYAGVTPLYATTKSKASTGTSTIITGGGFIESFRPELLSDTNDSYSEKISIYDKILEEADVYANSGDNQSPYEYIDIEDSTGGDFTSWKQYSKNWGSILLGSSTATIKSAGCLVTSVAIQIARSGTKILIDSFNPGTFVQILSRNSGFNGANFTWKGWDSIAPNFKIVNKSISLPTDKAGKISTVKEKLDQGYYIVMCVKNCGHWVAVTGVTNDNINIVDPGSKATTAWNTYSVAGTVRIGIFERND